MLSVQGSAELRAVSRAVAAARRDVRNNLNRATRTTLNPVWRERVAAHARTDLDRQVLVKGARILAGNPPVLKAATSTRKLKGGLVPAVQYFAVEFGGDRGKVETYHRTSPKGRAHDVHRHTARQLPVRRRTGRVVMAAVEDIAPRATSLWVQLVVKTFAEAFEAGER